MQTFVLPSTSNPRRGITLMEVLISIGIIAIGLTSVMSLIPAGKSEAGKALVYDRAAAMAMNCLSDAISYGMTRPDAFVAANSAATTIVFDHANAVSWPGVASVGSLKSAGVLAAQSNAATSPLTVVRLLTQGRDDVAYNPPAAADDLPTNGFVNGIRGFEGRMTSLVAITESDGGVAPLAAGDIATLSVVTFHNRDLATPTVSGTMYTSGLVELSSLPAGRSLKAIMRPGTVMYYVDPIASRVRFCQLSMAAVDTDSADTYVTLAGRPIPSGNVPVTVLVDSVGLAEQTVALEGPSPYGQ